MKAEVDKMETCKKSGSFCTTHKCQWGVLDDVCKKAARLPKCSLTDERMRIQDAYLVNPIIVAMIGSGGRLQAKFDSSVVQDYVRIMTMLQAGNGKIIQINPVIAKRLTAGINSKTEYPGRVVIDGKIVPVFINVIEEKKIQKNRDDAIVAVAVSILHSNKRMSFSQRKTESGQQLTQCVVAANSPDACICGEWHDWTKMPAIRRPDKDQYFGFGPACAEVMIKNGIVMDGTLQELVQGKPRTEARKPESWSTPRHVEEMDFQTDYRKEGRVKKPGSGRSRQQRLDAAEKRRQNKNKQSKKKGKGKGKSKKDQKAQRKAQAAAAK